MRPRPGAVAAEQGGLDGNGAGAAERVPQRPFGVPVAELHEGCGEGFLERGGAGEFAVTPFMQAFAGGVDRHCGGVAEERDLDGELGAVFLEPVALVGSFEAFRDRFLGDSLHAGNGGNHRADAFSADGELGVDGEIAVPRQGDGVVEQFAEVAGGECADFDEDAIGGAEPEVGAADGQGIAHEGDAAILDGLLVVAQFGQFARDDSFQTEGGGGDEFDTIHERQCFQQAGRETDRIGHGRSAGQLVEGWERARAAGGDGGKDHSMRGRGRRGSEVRGRFPSQGESQSSNRRPGIGAKCFTLCVTGVRS